MSRSSLLVLALASAGCFSDNMPRLTAGLASDSTSDTGTTTEDPSTTAADPTTGSTSGTSDDSTTTTSSTTSTTSTSEPPTTGDTDDTTTGIVAVDPCSTVVPVCPEGPTLAPGGGLETIDRCNFPLVQGPEWITHGALLEQLAAVLPTKSIGDLVLDLDHTAEAVPEVPGAVEALEYALRWDDEDFDKYWWLPRGLTGTRDAFADGLLGGRELALVSWYFDGSLLPNTPPDKGARITIVDVSEGSDLGFRHVLLVEPVAGNPVNFRAVPVHAGGVAWYGHTLYLADPSEGLRVFDLSRLLEVDATVDAIGHDPETDTYYGGLYSHVAVQIGAYRHGSNCDPQFSSLALDRTTSPPQLVVGEFCDNAGACDGPYHGRVLTWPIDPVTGRLPETTTWASDAAYLNETRVEGLTRASGVIYLSSSAASNDTGTLHVLAPGEAGVAHGWIDHPAGLMVDGERIWGLSEESGARYVFAAGRDAYQ